MLWDLDIQQRSGKVSRLHLQGTNTEDGGSNFKVYTYLVTKIVTPQTFANRINRRCVRAE
jgi:hypothetical protein